MSRPVMTTLLSSGLSPEAKEFVPSTQIPCATTIPLYTNENPFPSVYSTEQQSLVYPLIEVPEVEFHVQPSQQFHIDSHAHNQSQSSINVNTSQTFLLPTSESYSGSGGEVFYSSNDQTVFHPIDYREQLSLIDYPYQQTAKSNRISSYRQPRDTQHSSYNYRNFYPKNNKRVSRGRISSRQIQQHNKQNKENYQNCTNDYHSHDNGSSFEFQQEDFPSLPITKQQTTNIMTQSTASNHTKPTTPYCSIVSSRPDSLSPHSAAICSSKLSQNQQNRSQSLSKNLSLKNKRKPSAGKNSAKTNPKTSNFVAQQQQHSPSLTNIRELTAIKTDQTKQQRQKSSTKQKKKAKDTPIQEDPPSVPFFLDDEEAFPILGQEVATTKIKISENDSSTKDKVSTAGLISKAKIEANQTYQICFEDMFNALSISTRIKQENSHHKTINKSLTTSTVSANPLDSNPAPKRGKEREQPKPHKPTRLRRIINKELEENKKQRQQLFVKTSTIKQTAIKDESNENNADNLTVTDDCFNHLSMNTVHVNVNEYTSTAESNNETDDDDDDDDALDHPPTSQLQTPYAQQMSQSNVKQQIHDAGFREYCSQIIDRQLDELCVQLLLTLKRFQDRKKQQFQANPERARRKRRFIHGIREVTKHLRLKRLKCVLIAPDCQSIQSQGGLNDVIKQIINSCQEQNIPYIFTLNRQKLGRCLNKTSRVSTIGIFDYSGAAQIYQQIVDITYENQRAYKQIIDNVLLNHDDTKPTASHGLNSREFYKILHRTFQQQQQQQRHHIVNTIPNESLSKVLPKVPAHYAHSRQTSDTSTIYIDPQLINSIKKQHTRASSGTFDINKQSTKKNHQRALSDSAASVNDVSVQIRNHSKTHSRTPSNCSVISQTEQQDYFEQSKNILMNSNDEISIDNGLKSIHEDTEENAANIKKKNIEKWINDN